jgi:hypothetical protein
MHDDARADGGQLAAPSVTSAARRRSRRSTVIAATASARLRSAFAAIIMVPTAAFRVVRGEPGTSA